MSRSRSYRERKVPLIDVLADRFPMIERERLLALIMVGDVFVADERVRDPRTAVATSASVHVREDPPPVGRGHQKIMPVLLRWEVIAAGSIVLDVGASTGGFTEAAMECGAGLVTCVDVGTNQLAYRLRQDSRVRVMERTNILSVTSIDPLPDVALVDVSFRSLHGLVAHLFQVLEIPRAVALIKPQFEHPTSTLDGVVVDEMVIRETVERLVNDLYREGVQTRRLMRSPVCGRRGNREVFADMVPHNAESPIPRFDDIPGSKEVGQQPTDGREHAR